MAEQTENTNISEEDKIEFFKCFLADKPYIETRTLFDGKFNLKFTTLTTKQTTDVYDQLRQAQLNDELTNDPNYLVTMTSYRMGLSLLEVNGQQFSTTTFDNYKPENPKDSYVKERAKLFKDWPIFKLSAVAEEFKAFEHKVVALTDAIQKENFWKAVG